MTAGPLDVEAIRYTGEAAAALACSEEPYLSAGVAAASQGEPVRVERIRRHLLARSVQLTRGMAPDAWAAAERAKTALGVSSELEIYQAAGAENAAIHLVEDPVLLEIRGRMLSLVDAEAAVALMGHELGHWLAHGPTSEHGILGMVCGAALSAGFGVPASAVAAASRLAMCRELTADRFGLLAAGSLEAALRLEMAGATGLAVGELTWDTHAYLAQCTALIEQLESEGGSVLGTSHPEHGLRAWALALWAQSDVYQRLTGGQGGLPIADVDARIARVLGETSSVDLAHVGRADEPIPEVMECALASAVLIALADGELAEEEAVVIEGLFAAHVPDFSRYLNWDNALEAFADTGTVVVHGGPRAQRAVFQVLIQVLNADGEVRQSEIEMVCAIGDALKCGASFRAWLTPVLTQLGIDGMDLDAAVRPIPMPARADEAEAALDLFLTGTVRRRGGETTLRSLARLLGDAEGSPASRDQIGRQIQTHALVSSHDLSDVGLDERITLSLTPELLTALDEQDRPTVAADTEPTRERLMQAITRLRDQLVSGDGRSPSVRLRRCRTGRSVDLHRLEGVSVGHATRVLTSVTEGAPARIVDGKEVGVHDGADAIASELVALEREAQSRLEETGARDLFVGHPFLTGVVEGYLVRAPLILYPVDLERTRGRGFRLVPRDGDPPVANQALVRLLFAKTGRTFPEDLASALDTAAEQGLDTVRGVLSDHGIVARPEQDGLVALEPRDEAFAAWASGRLVLETVAALGFFPQSSSDMVHDYDALLSAIADPTEPLAERFGAAGALLPAELRDALGVDEPYKSPDHHLIPVVSADPSQFSVLQQARRRRALVVDGPPGTGKSQVIVNLVADALANGESVAVVCEKRAALDVVAQRLEQVGLRHLLAVVHDVNDDRRSLYEQVVRRLGDGMLHDDPGPDAERVREELEEVRQALAQRRQALATSLGDELPTLGQLHVIATSFLTPPLEGLSATVSRLPLRDVRRLADRIGREFRNADLHTPDAVWRGPGDMPRPSLAELTPQHLIAIEQALMAARITATALDVQRQSQGVDDQAVVQAANALDAAHTASTTPISPLATRALAAMCRSDQPDAIASLMAGLQAAWKDVPTWLPAVPERARFEVPPDLDVVLAPIRRLGTSLLRFLSPAWWSARSRLRALVAAQWPAALGMPTGPGLADQVTARRTGSDAYAALDKVLAALALDAVVPDTNTAQKVVQDLIAAWDLARPALAHQATLEAIGCWPLGAPGMTDTVNARRALGDAARAHAEAIAPVRAHLPWLPPTPDATHTQAIGEAWALDAHRVVQSDRNLDAAATLHPDARSMVWALTTQRSADSEAAWREAVEHGWALTTLHATTRRHPEVRTLERPTPFGEVGEAEQRLAELGAARADHHIAQLLHRADRVPLLTEARPDKGARRTPLQKAREQMLREASKKRYVLSLRGFVRQFSGEGLMDILPVWLVSPETMAVLFPGRPVFDRVIMDEASQATVEKGLPALMRGHRAVIAGDERQMPPSKYFQLASPGDDDAVGTAETVQADALTAESVLVLARERCAHTGLRWHYRCLHEELIAFSNHAMYGGDLFTIPSTATPEAAPALQWVSVEDATYERGVNPKEASRVVDLIDELLQESPPPSIGVVSFNIQQRRRILDEIDQRAEADASFAERWQQARSHTDLDKRPFVKNLEAVQGDERDVILFSLGHAPTRRLSGPLKGQLAVAARFGPLGQEGGGRRLNVAVSRAKARCIIVASFTPSMLSVANTRNEGPKLFKAFLEYAWDLTHGRRRTADKTLERIRHGSLGGSGSATRPSLGVPSLAAQIGLALADRNIGYDLDVGSSGFRVPLALRDPDETASWRVAVLTEEGHEAGSVHQAHVHEPGVLRARAWRVVRVSAHAWHTNPERVLDTLTEALTQACEEALAARQLAARAQLEAHQGTQNAEHSAG